MPRKRKKRVVIIGNSAAGLSAAEAFRKRDRDSKVVIIDREPFPFYSRVITPYFIMGGVKEEEGLFLRTKDFYKKMDIRALLGREVLSIDTRSREVVLNKGKREPFDLLLIATGSSPNRPEIKGVKAEEIHVLRNLDEARKLRELKRRLWKPLFLGGGLVSLQTLQALFVPKHRYTLVVKSDHILSQTLDREASQMVGEHLERMGVRVIKGRDVLRVERDSGVTRAILDNDEEIETDFIFAGKGVRPNTGFLEGSSVEVRGGIPVNEFLESSVEGIYAAGDVAQAPDFFSGEKVGFGLWPSAVEQGEVAGKNLGGMREKYPGNLRMNVTRVFAMPVASIGDIGSKNVAETLVRKDERRQLYRKICLDGKGIIIGALWINQADDVGVIRGLIRERKDVTALKTVSNWRSPLSYGFVYKNIIQGKL